ncbi:MAG: DUF1501 domain-containing protein [Planctomycetota bacterium]|nr:DUF1501 domain-containing protein [Planctomycetota bacterium]MDA1212623.1 DUF1501 domain-containing protein [Planctomycetota bacterium]
MHPLVELGQHHRRDFLTSAASGLGMAALGALLQQDNARTFANDSELSAVNPLAPKAPHFAPKAKSCIFLFQAGAPSHLDLFISKPKLNELSGQPVPASLVENVRFAFIQKETATLLGTNRKFTRHGECGMEFSDILPHLATCADDLLKVNSLYSSQFNHHPGQLLVQCGRQTFGLPSMGSWLSYGLGSESQNLPGYVVLTSGRGSSGGSTLWQSGFLPSLYSGVRFRTEGEPVLNLANPDGLPPELQRKSLDVLRDLNASRFDAVHDPEIASRISSYELAYRMQSAAPELIDISGESKATLDAYGVERPEPEKIGGRGKQGDVYKSYARNCLLARRLVERGVRFVNIVYASWDHHSNLDNELPYNAGACDQPVAALIKDLKARGMLDETLVVWGCEFGRTPLGENRGGAREANTGRDHHPYAFTFLMAGGGIKGGQTYGDSDEIGWGTTDNPTHINDFHATLLHLFGVDHLKLTHRFQGRDFRLTDVGGKVIPEWLA